MPSFTTRFSFLNPLFSLVGSLGFVVSLSSPSLPQLQGSLSVFLGTLGSLAVSRGERAIENVPPSEKESKFYSHYFFVPKKDGCL